MITFLLGLPGSGKSYYAVDRIFNNFSSDIEAKKDTKVTFQNCYTNINEFNYNKVENVKRLDFDLFYSILVRLHGFAKAKKSDKYMIRFLQLVKLKDTLFVIDEAHNYFDKRNTVLVWWLSYHRHLYHEIILITQNLALIESKYKSFSEFFYKAQSQSLTLDKRYFSYTVFCSSRMNKDSRSGKIKIKRNPKVFELYHSGDSINASNIVLKFLLIAAVILIVLVAFFKFFIMDKGKKEDLKPQTIEASTQISQKSFVPSAVAIDSEKKDYATLVFFQLACGMNKCQNKDISIPPALLSNFITDKSVTVLFTDKKSDFLFIYYLESSQEFYNFLKPQKEDYKNEKSDTKGNINFGSIMPSSSNTSK
ncbi:MAG: hypothetical protein NTW78_09125 [Campylobacterales bacterium]|nr:hypothetical protein [Campylobacterales bacterium]